MNPDSSSPRRTGTPAAYRVPIEAMNALRDGRPIEAIKIIRTSGNFGLAEAKAMVDELQRQAAKVHRGRGNDGLSPGEMPRGEGAGKLLAFMILVAVVIFAVLHWR